jgi:hypothetical protein
MVDTELNGRAVVVLRGDPRADLNAVADAIVASAKLRNCNGSLIWLNGGKLIPVSAAVLSEIIPQHVVTERLINRGSTSEPNWVVEYRPLAPPTEKALATLLRAEKLEEGSLRARAPSVALG